MEARGEQSYLPAEGRARRNIDAQLEASGWVVQDRKAANLGAARGVAIREFRHTAGKRSDYALYIDRQLVGVLEAKPEGLTLAEVEPQTLKYVTGVPDAMPAPLEPLPFGYESTGKETRFTCFYDPHPRAREVFSFHRPETLAEWLRDMTTAPERGTLRRRFKSLPRLERGNLWEKQQTAINNLEKSLCEDRPRALVQMATGSGKTFTAASLSYRLIRYANARRILFLVDRKNLGIQAEGEFQGFEIPETGRKFTQEYNVQRLKANRIDPTARVCISTIQRMYSILRGDAAMDEELDEKSADSVAPTRPVEVAYNPAVPPETFDVIVIDECHRSIYSVWRQVIEYFDAYLIGLTATPTAQTLGFFRKNLVMEYPHEQAVVDKVNVDYSVYEIRTEIGEKGSAIEAGEFVGYRRRDNREKRWAESDESVVYTGSDLDRKVVAPDQIRTVIRTFRDKLFTEIFPGRRVVPKTLIFAKDDSHAEDIVQIVREEFGKGNDWAQKITYRTTDGDPEVLLAAFRNSPNPRIVVTVDMIATGTDVKPIECLLFMRDTKSRSYFQQMVGRGTRVMDDTDFQSVTPDAKHKDRFVVVDAIGVTNHRFPESVQPLDRKPAVSLEKILDTVALGGTIDQDIASSLASRLVRLDHDIQPAARVRLTELNHGTPIRSVAADIVNALDPDRQHAAAEARQPNPNPAQIAAAARDMLATALQPLTENPELRKEILVMRRSLEQTIDEAAIDTLLRAGHSEEAKERARTLVSDFTAFVKENPDKIHALQVLYSRPYRERPTFRQIKELANAIEQPPRLWTPEKLWRAYELLDKSKVKGSGGRMLTDMVALVRFTLEQDSQLVPFRDQVEARFGAWLAGQEQKGVRFTNEQLRWLNLMKESIASGLEVDTETFEYPPYLEHGGIGKAVEVFGDRLRPLMDELSETLAA